MMLALTGVALAAASQAQAQMTYNNEDLLLDFRTPAATGNVNVTVDLGQVSLYSGLNGNTIVLDSGAGASFTSAEVTGAFGSLNGVGFTAAAVDATSGSYTTWVTRTLAGQPTGTPSTISAQPLNRSTAVTIGNQIANIGNGAAGFYSDTTATSLDASGQIVSVASGSAHSYQTQGTPSGQPATITFRGESTSGLSGGSLESVTDGADTVYSALWEVPYKNNGSDTYLGYFTFNGANGELDFTEATTAVPEPSTYSLIAGAGIVAALLRRQFRSLTA